MHTIKKIGQTFSYITPISLTDRPILGMVEGNNKTLMIDAGNSEDHAKYFAADSVIVYVKEEKILFLGDCIYPKMYAEKVHYTMKEILRLLDELDAFDADTYIPSHQRPWTKDEFRQERDKIRMIAKYTDIVVEMSRNHERISTLREQRTERR
ncbi:hypothetical protein BSAF29S_03520 [Bacillus safensis subsp. safensis]